ncbi:DUF2913 family protein [Vibrio sp. 99-70-13A1]|uniref:DUF2913 family protein n=1 Tax=Vibrio sp. 99-70-13A1 TaxID=2607601 RepID=UPI001493C42B|nr:DUF2913 family protein [Vibrio sp. 99-70-13A1]
MKSLLSKEEQAHLLLRELSLSALLHLEFKQLEKKSPLPLNDKNLLLKLWLKKQSTTSKYKLLKKKLKSLLSATNNQKVNLEVLFLEVINFHSEVKAADLEEYLLLVRSIERELNSTVMLSSPNEVDLDYKGGKDFICVLADDLNRHFSPEGHLESTISFLGKLSKYDRTKVFNSVFMFNRFSYEVKYEDDNFVRFDLSKNVAK